MQHRLYLIIFIVLLMALPAGVCAQTTVAVMPFEGEEIRDWYIDRQQMINGITATFTDQLSSLGDVRVVERSRLDQILREQDFGYSGRVDTFHAAEIGRLLGADLLILGTVQAIELKESGGIQISMLRAKGTTAKIELSIRVVDTETGVILGSVQASGSNTGASFAVNNLFGVSFYSDAFKNSVLGKALGQAVEELVTNMLLT